MSHQVRGVGQKTPKLAAEARGRKCPKMANFKPGYRTSRTETFKEGITHHLSICCSCSCRLFSAEFSIDLCWKNVGRNVPRLDRLSR